MFSTDVSLRSACLRPRENFLFPPLVLPSRPGDTRFLLARVEFIRDSVDRYVSRPVSSPCPRIPRVSWNPRIHGAARADRGKYLSGSSRRLLISGLFMRLPEQERNYRGRRETSWGTYFIHLRYKGESRTRQLRPIDQGVNYEE